MVLVVVTNVESEHVQRAILKADEAKDEVDCTRIRARMQAMCCGEGYGRVVGPGSGCQLAEGWRN